MKFLIIGLVSFNALAGDFYHCVDPNGVAVYSDRACSPTAESKPLQIAQAIHNDHYTVGRSQELNQRLHRMVLDEQLWRAVKQRQSNLAHLNREMSEKMTSASSRGTVASAIMANAVAVQYQAKIGVIENELQILRLGR